MCRSPGRTEGLTPRMVAVALPLAPRLEGLEVLEREHPHEQEQEHLAAPPREDAEADGAEQPDPPRERPGERPAHEELQERGERVAAVERVDRQHVEHAPP